MSNSIGNKEHVLRVVKSSLILMGVEERTIDASLDNVSDILVCELPNTNVVRENRPADSSSNQSHIAITGKSMNYFFTQEELRSRDSDFADWRRYDVNLFAKNICFLNERAVKQIVLPTDMQETVRSFTHVKIGRIASPAVQVQVGYRRGDKDTFECIRRGLVEDDLLVFIRCGYVGEEEVWVVGIPHDLLAQAGDNNELKNTCIVEPRILVTDLSIEEGGVQSRRDLRAVDYSSIASFEPSDEDGSDDKVYSKTGVAIRKARTQRHQDIVKMAAYNLQREGFTLQEGTVDMLAMDMVHRPLLFEVKTLNGKYNDEVEQVRKALSQLLYYEAFDVKEETTKIALFESKVSDVHIAFLKKYDVQCVWLGKGSDSAFFFNKDGMIELKNLVQ